MTCDTKYPLLFLRGFAFRDKNIYTCWGRIPDELTSRGAKFYVGYTDAVATSEDNAKQIINRIDDILDCTKAEKVNIIAHSKGGLDARCAASLYDNGAKKIASITTLCTPNHGMKSVDKAMNIVPKFVMKGVSKIGNVIFKIQGDKKPDMYNAMQGFTTYNAEDFNNKYKDVDGIYYQSYAAIMSKAISDPMWGFTYLAMFPFDGRSDGLVPPKSAEWTNFKGIIQSPNLFGISHLGAVDFYKRPFSNRNKDGRVSNIPEFYVSLIEDLKNKGF